ncbi:MAG: DoxX family protein, partial [Geodermatophilaceae bacterium]|nr:DoxX family protein [Geodermatophilaceae bacterium]
IALAGVFGWAGLAKAGDLALSRLTVRSYQLLPDAVADAIGDVLPFVEFALAVLLLVGLGTRLAASLTAALLLAFLVGVSSLWLRGIEAACGCFGTSLLPDGSPTSYPLILARDTGLLMLAVLVAWIPVSRWSVDSVLDHPDPEER